MEPLMPPAHHASASRRDRVDARSATPRVIARTGRLLRLTGGYRGRLRGKIVLTQPARDVPA
jgi:hypothetical protein